MHAGERQLLVVRHGPAEAARHGDDAARRLSAEGRRRMRAAAAALARLLPAPARIATSPLVRARETAEVLAVAWNAPAPVATPLLAPGFDAEALLRELRHGDPGLVAAVGHEPDLSEFVGWLLGGPHRVRVKLGKGSACLVDLADPGGCGLHALFPLAALERCAG